MKLKRSLNGYFELKKGWKMSENKPLIILTGPTAVGKTKLSLQLAQKIGGEIISADSMQVYQYMDIGTAKLPQNQMQGVRHHLIDICKPWEEFNVVKFAAAAKSAIEDIYSLGKIPVIAGGTGFYIQAVLYDIHFDPTQDDNTYRTELEMLAEEKGLDCLHDMLEQVDHVSAELIHKNNKKRVIRALEYYKQTGKPISDHNLEERQRTSPYDFHYFVLTDHRENLYANIDQRVDEMMADGLVDEVKELMNKGCNLDMVSMQGLGYKEVAEYLQGNITYEEAVYLIKRDTRHFAKRQLTWFKRESEVEWFDKSSYGYDDELILNEMMNRVKNREN